MSLLLKGHEYCVVDHRAYLNNLYREVIDDQNHTNSYEINPKLFCIKTITRKMKENRKRKHDEVCAESKTVELYYDNFIKNIPHEMNNEEISKCQHIETKEVRELSQQLFEATFFKLNGVNGGNNSDKPVKCTVQNNNFIVPQQSRFLCGCVKEQCQKLCGNKYDLLIADPPWWNKYIRRLKNANDKISYSMMYNEEIADIPVRDLLATNCLVAVWCTNAPSNIDAVKNLIFPKWGVEYVTTWYWLKINIDFTPLCQFSSGCKKQPYERLIIGRVGQIREVPQEYLIISVPSALHSHKPPLLEILKPYLGKDNPETCELFARYLLPNTTSVGFEPLKWQHLSLYELTNKNHVS